MGRFISKDSIYYVGLEKLNGLKLYIYCNNNPIMYIDPEGHFAFFLITMLIGFAVETGVALYKDYKDNGSIGVGGYAMPMLIGGGIGATTLEMTRLGSYLETIEYSKAAWQLASSNFANQVPNGNFVYTFQNAAGISMSSMWATIEYPTLISKAVQLLFRIVGF